MSVRNKKNKCDSLIPVFILLSETNLLQPLGRRLFVVVLLACRVVEVPHLEIRRVLAALQPPDVPRSANVCELAERRQS